MTTGPSPYQPSDDPVHDCGPWVETPNSSRVRDYRFDYGTQQLQVRWRNRPPSEGYVYEADRHLYMNFARAVSKGQAINRVLTPGTIYRPATPEEINAPTNPKRRELTSRVHNTGNMYGRDG